ncbi:MAG: hypothetical protein IJ578_06190 [Bacteroidales bacterium]|nr:hypothetical protein [Bacteroidales bacterium]
MAGVKEYWERERTCEAAFNSGGPYYLMTTSQWPWLMYTNDEEFIQGSNILPIALAGTDVKCLDETMMNNHMHAILEGSQVDVVSSRYRREVIRMQHRIGHAIPSEWDIQFLRLRTLQEIRRAACYTDRNAYVARADATPGGYKWSSGNLFFNNNLWLNDPGVSWDELTVREKRSLCHSHQTDLPGCYRVKDGLILRSTYVDYHRMESFFQSAHQYFSMLSRHGEADMEVARQIGERILLPNEEVVKIVSEWYDKPLRQLTQQQRLDAAKKMKYQLSSNNKQISQVLSLPLSFVNDLYPVPR